MVAVSKKIFDFSFLSEKFRLIVYTFQWSIWIHLIASVINTYYLPNMNLNVFSDSQEQKCTVDKMIVCSIERTPTLQVNQRHFIMRIVIV